MLSWTPYILTVYVLLTKGTAGIVVVLVAQAAINYALKVTIREPRPDTSCGWSVWGMPSAHTQLMVLLVLMVWPTSPSARIVALLLINGTKRTDVCVTVVYEDYGQDFLFSIILAG
jgi:hypothetical protein